MSNPKLQTFGSELRNARERCRVLSQSGGKARRLSQEKFAEYINQELGKGTYPSDGAVSSWELDAFKPDAGSVPDGDIQTLLAAIVKVLHTHGGIKTAAEATALLNLGSWSLKDAHLDTIFGIGWRTSTQTPTDPLVLAEALLATLPLDQVPEPTTLPPGSRMTLRSNPFFTGRADDLRALAADLKAGRAAAITTGIGGVGKTQLAAELATRYGQYFAGGVFWLSFIEPDNIAVEIAACGGAGALELYTEAAGLTLEEQVARVRQSWASPLPRLLIFDNCDDIGGTTAEALLANHLPASGSGSRVLVTSRRGQWPTSLGLSQHPLDTLPRPESIALLRRHRPDLNDADADALADLLGDLPLALSLAGSYLETYAGASFAESAEYIKNLKQQLLRHRSMEGAGAGTSRTKHEQNVRATFQLSYDRLDPAGPVDALAIAALARAAHLAPGEPFPRALLLATLGEATDDENDEAIAAQRVDALQRLIALGLLEVAESWSLRIHRLISAFVNALLVDEDAQAAVEQTLIAIGNGLVNAGYPSQILPILAHLRHATLIADPRADVPAASLANTLAFAETSLINYTAARSLYERALQIREQVFGPTHPYTAIILNNLAELFRTQGDYAAARPLYEQALQITEETLGPTHPDTATSLNNLATLLQLQGDYAVALPLYEKALQIRRQVFGPTHPDIAQSLNNLAELFFGQGDYAAARPLYEQALQITEETLGPTHPNTATILNNLGRLLLRQGDYAAARALYERALQIREQVFGPTHPDVAQSLNNLATLLHAQGDYAAARPFYERALQIREQVFGSTHPATAVILNNMAELFRKQGDYAAARPLLERALQITEETLGTTHPSTATNLNNLALLLRGQGDDTAARPLFERALEIREQALGPTHPDIATSLNNLAGLLSSQGDYAAARPLFKRALQISELALGLEHQTTQIIRANFAGLTMPSQSRKQKISALIAQAEAAAAAALADPTSDRAALAQHLETVAQEAEEGEKEGSSYLALAAHLRSLAAQLTS